MGPAFRLAKAIPRCMMVLGGLVTHSMKRSFLRTPEGWLIDEQHAEEILNFCEDHLEG